LVIDENEQDVWSFGLSCLVWQRDDEAKKEEKEEVLHGGGVTGGSLGGRDSTWPEA
jgi:hypothetical protein